MQEVTLNMIVKDEAAVITRCLRAAAPHVNSGAILDTGSTDETKELIVDFFDSSGLEIAIDTRDWRGMAASRNEALELARSSSSPSELFLLLDADDTIEFDDDFEWPTDGKDGYYVKFRLGETSWWRIAVIRSGKPWYYRGDAHEVLHCDGRFSTGRLSGVRVICGRDGHRRATQSPAEKYGAVAQKLERVLEGNPDDTRALFYAAQSHRDAGNHIKALELYRKRVDAGGWIEERWYSAYQLGDLLVALEAPFDRIENQYLEAYTLQPTRAEPLVALSALLRSRGEPAIAHIYACAAREMPYPENARLFVTDSVYEWRARDEYAVTAFHVGKFREAIAENLKLLDRVPKATRPRIEDNLRQCMMKLSARDAIELLRGIKT